MKNEVIGGLFFCFLILGLVFGHYFGKVEIFGVIGLGLGLGIVLVFRKKN